MEIHQNKTKPPFIDDEKMKNFLEIISGDLETNDRYGNVAGNRCASGVLLYTNTPPTGSLF